MEVIKGAGGEKEEALILDREHTAYPLTVVDQINCFRKFCTVSLRFVSTPLFSNTKLRAVTITGSTDQLHLCSLPADSQPMWTCHPRHFPNRWPDRPSQRVMLTQQGSRCFTALLLRAPPITRPLLQPCRARTSKFHPARLARVPCNKQQQDLGPRLNRSAISAPCTA